jgi:hypothetical protein
MTGSKTTWAVFRLIVRLSLAIALVAAAFLASGRPIAAVPPAALPMPQNATGRVFASDAGMILNAIKADKTADFEMVVARLKDALQKSPNADRKRQAAGWRVFKAIERGANDSAIYVFWIDPPVKDADYTVSKILMEAFPGEAQELYKKFSDAYVNGQSVVNLQLFSRMGE